MSSRIFPKVYISPWSIPQNGAGSSEMITQRVNYIMDFAARNSFLLDRQVSPYFSWPNMPYLCKHARSKSNLFLVGIILAHSCLVKVQSIFSNRRMMFLTRCSSSKEALATFIYYSILRYTRPNLFTGKFESLWLFLVDDVICRGLVRSCPCDRTFSVSTRSMCVCDDWTPVYWFVVCYLLCLFMPGRVSRDMGLVWFLIPCFYRFCVFQPFWLISCGTDWD